MKINFEYLKKDEYFIHLLGELKILEIERNILKDDYDKRKLVCDEIDRICFDIYKVKMDIDKIDSYIESYQPKRKKITELTIKKDLLNDKLSKLNEKLSILDEREKKYDYAFEVAERKYIDANINYLIKDMEVQNYIRDQLSINPKARILTKEEE